MTIQSLDLQRVAQLPAQVVANTLYFVKPNGQNSGRIFLTNNSGTIIAEAMGGDGPQGDPGPASVVTTNGSNGGFNVGGALTQQGQQVFHTGNDGAGSGLDADLLDGKQANEFAATTGATFTGSINFTGSGKTASIGNPQGNVTFTKTTSDTDVSAGSSYVIENVGCLNPGNPFWQGLFFAGPSVTQSGGIKYPRTAVYWSAGQYNDPTDLRFRFGTGNVGTLKTDIEILAGDIGSNFGDVLLTPGASGGNVVANAPLKLKSFTVGTVPNPGIVGAGGTVFITNETGGPVIAFSDGGTWRRSTDRAMIS